MRTRLLATSLVAALLPVIASAQLAPPAVPGFPFSTREISAPVGQPAAEYTFSGCAPVNNIPNGQRGVPMCATGRLSIMPVPVQSDPALPPFSPNNFLTYLQIRFALAPGVRLLPDDDVQFVYGPGGSLRFGVNSPSGLPSGDYYAFRENAMTWALNVTPATPWTSVMLTIDYAANPSDTQQFGQNATWTMDVTPLGAAVVTPEPATCALLGTGLLVIGGVARRRRAA
jgi:hypothetical protein